jgi:hypothetical protein
MEILQYLEMEEELFNGISKIFGKVKDNVFDLSQLECYNRFIDLISSLDLRTEPHENVRLYASTSRFVNNFLRDLYSYVRDKYLSGKNKERILNILESMIGKLQDFLDSFYHEYSYLPKGRWYEHDYPSVKYQYGIPNYYNYQKYYDQRYPEKTDKRPLKDQIWDIINTKDNNADSRMFVPCSFPTGQEQYNQYLLLKISKELKEMKNKHQMSLEEEQQSKLSSIELKTKKIADYIIQSSRRERE